MSIQFSCHSCGRDFAAPDNMAGTKARCETCGAIVTVPRSVPPTAQLTPLGAGPAGHPTPTGRNVGGAGWAAPAGRPAARPPQTLAQLQAAQRGGSGGGVPKAVWIAAIAGGGVLVTAVFGLIVLWALFGSSDEEPVTADVSAPASQTPFYPSPLQQPAPSASPFGPVEPAPEPYRPPVSVPPPTSQPSPFQPAPSTEPQPLNTEHRTPNTDRPTPSSNPFEPQPSQPSAPPPPLDNGTQPSGSDAVPAVPNLADLARAAREGMPRLPPGLERPGAVSAEMRNPASADLTPWQATVDPPAQAIDYAKGKLSIPVSWGGVIFPDRPSNFVLVTGQDQRRRDVWQVYDLRTGKEIGKPVYPERSERPELFSPDGRYVAHRLSVSGSQAYGVYSFATGEFLREITGEFGWGPVSFAGPHQFVNIETKGDSSVVRMWDVTSGEKIREFSLFSDRNHLAIREAFTITPGARYLCSIEGNRLAAYDLTTGNGVGHAPVPGAAQSCLAMAFSHDGAELAALLNISSATHLVCWDFATGAITLDHAYDNSGGLSRWNASLQWLLDKRGWLCQGNILLDRQTGIEVWTFPEDRSNPRRMLNLSRMLAVVDSRAGKTLTYVDLPEKDLEKAVEAVRGGGQAVDTVLPKLVQANALSARAMTLPNGFTAWAAQPDPAGAPADSSDRELMIAKENETLKAALFTAPEAGRIVVQKTGRRLAGAGRMTELAFVERYDLKSGQKSQDIPLPLVYDLLDVSPTGDHVLVGFRQGWGGEYDRLDVMRFSPREHVAGWRPYEGEKSPESRSYGENPKHVRWAVMLGDGQVLTVNGAGKLTVWELPDCRAVYGFEDFGSPAAFSPRRRYMVGVHHQEIRIFETATGECRGDLKTPHTGVRLRRAAFRPDGSELAAVVDSGSGRDLAVAIWTLETGELKQEFPLSAEVFQWSRSDATGTLEWRGPRHLMLDQQYLIDLKNRAVVWRYHVSPGSGFAARSPDHRTWLCTPRENTVGGPLFLVATETPSVGARLKTEFATLEKQLLLGPGMSVQLNVQLGGDLQAKATQAVTEALQARGIRVDPAARLQFLLTTKQGSTGAQIDVTTIGLGRQPRASFAQQQITCVMAIKDTAGKELWSYQRGVSMRDFGVVHTAQVGDVQSKLNQEMQESFQGMMSSGSFISEGLPTYIFGELSQILAGASTLTFRSEGPPPPPPKPISR